MFRRRRRPLMRAAAVGGAGYIAGKRIQEGRDAEADPDAQDDSVEEQQDAPAGAMSSAAIEELRQLAELKKEGVLTEEEFNAQKQKLLQEG